MVLKALTFGPTGGIVAAPTTSLPEWPGGVRNWDYRYCWLRDATMTLYVLMLTGYTEEAAAWREWLLRAAAGDPARLQIMYGVSGERRLTEYEADWLPGYEGSSPVRIGNQAHEQLQLDVYGELSDALFQARRFGIGADPWAWDFECALLESLESRWSEPDEGIWEVRGPRRHFTHSKVMAWVAFDRAIKAVECFSLEAPHADAATTTAELVARWRATRDRIHAEVCARAFDPARNAFTQSYGSPRMDASLLLMPMVGFLPPHDPRIVGTVAGIERELLRDGFVQRYRTEPDGDGRRRRSAARRGRVPAVLVLARRRLRADGAHGRGDRALRALARRAQRSRPALRGVRPRRAPAARQLPAGAHAPGAGRVGAQPGRPRRAAREVARRRNQDLAS